MSDLKTKATWEPHPPEQLQTVPSREREDLQKPQTLQTASTAKRRKRMIPNIAMDGSPSQFLLASPIRPTRKLMIPKSAWYVPPHQTHCDRSGSDRQKHQRPERVPSAKGWASKNAMSVPRSISRKTAASVKNTVRPRDDQNIGSFNALR